MKKHLALALLFATNAAQAADLAQHSKLLAPPSDSQIIKLEKPKVAEKAIEEEKASSEKIISDNFSVIQKSLDSLENDSWEDAQANIKKVIEYYQVEFKKNQKEKIIDAYLSLSQSFKVFADAGYEVDVKDQPDFTLAEKLYQSAEELAHESQAKIVGMSEEEAKALSKLISEYQSMLDEELEYISDMLGL